MSAFAELGLREDAEEPDIKRAYARRLRSVRPDEDAEGFQALNAAYKAALAAARWRAQAAVDAGAAATEPAQSDTIDTPDGLASEAGPPPASPPAPAVPEPVFEAARVVDVPEALFDYARATESGAISFDFDAFLGDLFAVTADPEANLRAWLDARMASWPLAMKPTLAPYLLQALDDEDVAVSPQHFEVLINAFGLDDVLSRADPLAIAHLRAANESRWKRHEAVARARRLLGPGQGRVLDKAVRIGGYPPFVAPLLARLVTGAGAGRRVGLRWVPSLSRWVLNLLRYLSAGHLEALSPPIEAHVLQRWRSAESIIGWLRFSHIVLAACVLFGIWTALGSMMTSDADSLADERFEAIWREEGPQPQKAIDDYAALIAAHPPPRSVPLDRTVATAMFNKGIVLTKVGRVREAEANYSDFDNAFGESLIPHIRLLIAEALNNWAYLLAERGDYQAVLPVTRKVVARFQGYTDEDEDDSFEVQLARAMINEADALEHLGDRAATLAVCRDVLFRFAGAHSDKMKHLLSTARDIEGDYGVRTIVPARSPSSP